MYFQSDNQLFQIVGNNIKYYRKKAHLTQNQLAEKAGISLSYVSKIEASSCNKSISISVLNHIANCLNVDIIYFFKEGINNVTKNQ